MDNNVKSSPDDKYTYSHTFINNKGKLIYANKYVEGIHSGLFFSNNLYWIIIEKKQ